MSRFTITHAGRDGSEQFSNYLFDVFLNGHKVAELSHDYRGDEQWMRLPGGPWISLAERMIEGGGPRPLTLSSAGKQALQNLIVK